MVLFLVGLCSIDDEIIKVAKIDGVGFFSIYVTIILLMFWFVFMSAVVIFCYIFIKSYDFVIVLMVGGLGISLDMFVVFMM